MNVVLVSVILLNGIMLNVIMLNVVMQSVAAPRKHENTHPNVLFAIKALLHVQQKQPHFSAKCDFKFESRMQSNGSDQSTRFSPWY